MGTVIHMFNMTAKYKFKTAWVGASQVALGVKNPPANAGDTRDLGLIPWRRKWDPIPVFFPHRSVGRESAFNAGDPSLIPGWGRPPGEGIDYLLLYFWASFVAQLVKNPPAMWETRVRSLDWEDPLEKGKATHSSMLAWRIPWTV